MTKKDHRERNIRNNTGNVSLIEFEALIKRYYSYKRSNPVNGHYVRGVLRLIDEMEE
jgi:hypothetical protein